MIASAFPKSLRFALALGAASLCSACNSMNNLIPPSLNAQSANVTAAQQAGATSDTGKVVVLPMNSQDLDCPMVDVQDGASFYRIGGSDNASVKYQFAIAQTARQCDPQGDKFVLKVGVSGHLAIGPAGSPGAYSAPLRITVVSETDKKPAYSKTYKVEANTAGAAEAQFNFVSEPIVLPMTRTELNEDYSIEVGFDTGRSAEAAPPHKRHAKQAGVAH
jgi:hypothetical protein